MKILKLEIIEVAHRPLMNGLLLECIDPSPDGNIRPNIFIGINGSGKSQLLETIAEIFLYLDRLYRKINKTSSLTPPLLFAFTPNSSPVIFLTIISGSL